MIRGFFGAQIGQTANSVLQNLGVKQSKFSTVSKLKNVGDSEWQIFRRTLCAGDFSLGVQREFGEINPRRIVKSRNVDVDSTNEVLNYQPVNVISPLHYIHFKRFLTTWN